MPDTWLTHSLHCTRGFKQLLGGMLIYCFWYIISRGQFVSTSLSACVHFVFVIILKGACWEPKAFHPWSSRSENRCVRCQLIQKFGHNINSNMVMFLLEYIRILYRLRGDINSFYANLFSVAARVCIMCSE